jgi:hypothetical protein
MKMFMCDWGTILMYVLASKKREGDRFYRSAKSYIEFEPNNAINLILLQKNRNKQMIVDFLDLYGKRCTLVKVVGRFPRREYNLPERLIPFGEKMEVFNGELYYRWENNHEITEKLPMGVCRFNNAIGNECTIVGGVLYEERKADTGGDN